MVETDSPFIDVDFLRQFSKVILFGFPHGFSPCDATIERENTQPLSLQLNLIFGTNLP